MVVTTVLPFKKEKAVARPDPAVICGVGLSDCYQGSVHALPPGPLAVVQPLIDVTAVGHSATSAAMRRQPHLAVIDLSRGGSSARENGAK